MTKKQELLDLWYQHMFKYGTQNKYFVDNRELICNLYENKIDWSDQQYQEKIWEYEEKVLLEL